MRRILGVFLILVLSLFIVAWKQLVYQAPEYVIELGQDGGLRLMPVYQNQDGSTPPAARPASGASLAAVDNLVNLAIADLGARLHLEPGDISRWSLRQVTFRDASLGKPLAGRMYAQVLTAGYEITLRAGDALYLYHGAGSNVVYIGPVSGPKNLPDNSAER
ncbi:MAG: hypothetical protein ACYC6L_08075 [Anaerolineae bacterium]